MIGATTLDEFHDYIETDRALERRMQPVMVEEPTIPQAITIIDQAKGIYEKFHGIQISSEAVRQAVRLSVRYITDRFLPDKAIDLIDEAAARIKMEIDSKPETLDKLDRRLIQLKIEREAVRKEKDEASKKRFALIEEEIARLEKESQPLKVENVEQCSIVYLQISSKIDVNFIKGNKKYKAEILFDKKIDGESEPEISFVLLNDKELNEKTILTDKDYSLLFDSIKDNF